MLYYTTQLYVKNIKIALVIELPVPLTRKFKSITLFNGVNSAKSDILYFTFFGMGGGVILSQRCLHSHFNHNKTVNIFKTYVDTKINFHKKSFNILGNAHGKLRATSDMFKVEHCGSSPLTSNRKIEYGKKLLISKRNRKQKVL
jgi:hypothetical protein